MKMSEFVEKRKGILARECAAYNIQPLILHNAQLDKLEYWDGEKWSPVTNDYMSDVDIRLPCSIVDPMNPSQQTEIKLHVFKDVVYATTTGGELEIQTSEEKVGPDGKKIDRDQMISTIDFADKYRDIVESKIKMKLAQQAIESKKFPVIISRMDWDGIQFCGHNDEYGYPEKVDPTPIKASDIVDGMNIFIPCRAKELYTGHEDSYGHYADDVRNIVYNGQDLVFETKGMMFSTIDFSKEFEMLLRQRAQRLDIAERCLNSGKSPMYIQNFDPNSSLYSNGIVGPEDLKPGDFVQVLNAGKYDKDGQFHEDGVIIPKIHSISYDQVSGTLVIESGSTIVVSQDVHKIYEKLLQERLQQMAQQPKLAELVDGKSVAGITDALRKECEASELRPVIMANVEWSTLKGNHDGTDEYPGRIDPSEVEPGMRLYVFCDTFDVQTGEPIHQDETICISNVQDFHMSDGEVYIKTLSGELLTTLDIAGRNITQNINGPDNLDAPSGR
jgi:hypothetical protein